MKLLKKMIFIFYPPTVREIYRGLIKIITGTIMKIDVNIKETVEITFYRICVAFLPFHNVEYLHKSFVGERQVN